MSKITTTAMPVMTNIVERFDEGDDGGGVEGIGGGAAAGRVATTGAVAALPVERVAPHEEQNRLPGIPATPQVVQNQLSFPP